MSEFTGRKGAKRAKDEENYLYTVRQTWQTASSGKKIQWNYVKYRKENFKCSGSVMTNEDLVIFEKKNHSSNCKPGSALRIGVKLKEQEVMAQYCRGAEQVGGVYIKIKKELKKARLEAFGTKKHLLKN